MSASLRGALLHPSGVATWPVPAAASVAALPLPEDRATGAGDSGTIPGGATAPAGADAGTARSAGDPAVAAAPGSATAAANEAASTIAGAGASPAHAVTARPVATATSTTTPQAFAAAPADAGALGGTVLALLLVVGLILLLGWLARRMPGVAGTGNPALRIVGSLALGPRERVVVVEVGGTQLLLSTGAGGTRALHTLVQPLPMPAPAASPFAQLLAQQVRQSVGLRSKGPKQA